MAFTHGKDTIVTLDGVVITALVNTTGVDSSVEDGDVTTFADDARKFIPGLADNGEIPLEGPFDPTLWNQLVALKGVAGKVLRITAGNGASGMPYVEATGFVNKLSGSFQVGDPNGISASLKVNGNLTHGTVV